METAPTSELLASPLLPIAATLVIAVIFYVLSYWTTGKVNKNRKRKQENHLAAGGADVSLLREPMHMFERQTWAAGIALWVIVFAVMISTKAS